MSPTPDNSASGRPGGASPLFVLRMAWRETRTSRARLLLYTAAITLGIMALVLIASVGDSLRRAVRDQSTALLGADLVARANEPFPAEVDQFLASLGGRQAREMGCSSMALFPAQGRSRLVGVRAVEDGFPFYGRLDTVPAEAAQTFRQGPQALVEESVLLQFGVKPGDEIKIGAVVFTVAGALRSVPGDPPGFSMIAPRVYVPMRYLEATGLVQRGSRVSYRAYVALPPGRNADQIRAEHRQRLRELDVWLESVGSREARTGRIIGNVERFFGLVGFVALLLGGVGVASGIHVFIRRKLASIAVLRCLGATGRQAFLVYLIQAVALGFVGATAGALLGALTVGGVLPRLLDGLLPIDVELGVSWRAVAEGLAAGVGVTVALALLPLLTVRRVSPLLALRSTIEPARGSWRDPATLGVIVAGLAAITAIAIQRAATWQQGVGFVVGSAVVFGVLALLGLGLMHAARRMIPAAAPYAWRQGVANLFRPNNRTLLVILALGLGTFLIVTMQLVQGMLVGQLGLSRQDNQTNLVFFDIQSDQRLGAREVVEAAGLPVLADVPIVTMRIASVKGSPVEVLRRDHSIPRWVLGREYRSTYRRDVAGSDLVVKGAWVGEVAPGATGPVPVSIEEEIADSLHVDVGDAITFDVQGLSIDCVVASLRRVEKGRFGMWFFVTFPAGVLEDAPQFGGLATHVDDAMQSAAVQGAMLERYPTVSAIDLMLIMQTVNGILDQATLVFSVMASLIVITGLIVLVGVMVSGRFQRLQESVLLRTLGASRAQLARIQLIEYLLLGTLASLAGVVLAWGGAWVLGRWVFELEVAPAVGPVFAAWAVVSVLTILTGWLSGRQVLNHPPLEILRREV